MKSLIKLISIVVLSLGFVTSAWALSLDEARSKGMVVELPTGYIQAKNPKAKSLEKTVNAKRKKAYEVIAKKTKTTADVVGKQAHKKIMKGLKGK